MYNKRLLAVLEKYEGQGMWINFNDVTKGSEQKTMPNSPSSNQGDPIGIYVYPSDWVLENWHSITRGPLMKYARVLKATTSDQLRVDEVSPEQWVEINRKLLTALGHNITRYKDDQLMEYLSVPNILSYSFNIKEIPAMITRAYVKVGYRMLIDRSGVIEPNEPNQAVFLTRDGYEVVESIQNESTGDEYDDDVQLRGLVKAAKIALVALHPKSTPKLTARERNHSQMSVTLSNQTNNSIKLEFDANDPHTTHVTYNGKTVGDWDPQKEPNLHKFILSNVNAARAAQATTQTSDLEDVPF